MECPPTKELYDVRRTVITLLQKRKTSNQKKKTVPLQFTNMEIMVKNEEKKIILLI